MAADGHLRVDLWMGERSLTGTATDDNGVATPFAGWLGLIAAVEAAQHRLARTAETATPAGSSLRPVTLDASRSGPVRSAGRMVEGEHRLSSSGSTVEGQFVVGAPTSDRDHGSG